MMDSAGCGSIVLTVPSCGFSAHVISLFLERRGPYQWAGWCMIMAPIGDRAAVLLVATALAECDTSLTSCCIIIGINLSARNQRVPTPRAVMAIIRSGS